MTAPETIELVQRIRTHTAWCLEYRSRPENAGKTYADFWAEHDARDPDLLQILEGYRGREIPEPLKSACLEFWTGLDHHEWGTETRGSQLPVGEVFGLGPSSGRADRDWLDRHLDELARRVPRIVESTPPEHLMDEFAGCADVIHDAAKPEDLAHVDARLDCILHEAGLVPGDEAEPCDDA